MSYLRTAASVEGAQGLIGNDDRIQMPSYSSAWLRDGPDQLWDRSGLMGGGGGSCIWGNLTTGGDLWDMSFWFASAPGVGQKRDGITGVTRDSTGAALGSVTVKLFDVSTDLLVDTTVSDSNGNFTVTTPFTGKTVYAVAYKAGTPVYGATAQLTPS